MGEVSIEYQDYHGLQVTEGWHGPLGGPGPDSRYIWERGYMRFIHPKPRWSLRFGPQNWSNYTP